MSFNILSIKIPVFLLHFLQENCKNGPNTKFDFETINYNGLVTFSPCRHYKAAMSSQLKILLIAAFSLPSYYCRFVIFFSFFFQFRFEWKGGQNVLKNIQAQLNGTYSLGKPIKVTILADDLNGFSSFFREELAKQLAKFTLTVVEVSLLVPESSQINDWDKRGLEENGVTIIKAKRQPGFTDPIDWLYYQPEDLKTDIVIGIGARLGKIAQHWKERYQCKKIYVDQGNEWLLSADEFVETYFEDLEGYRKELCTAANIPVAIGPKTTDDLSASLRSERKQVFNLTPGIISEFGNLNHATNDGRNFRVLLVGGDNPDNFQEEGLKLAAETMAELNDKSYHLIYVGARKETEKQFANLFHQCGVPKRQLTIRSLPKTKQEWKDLFCEVDLAIMPSGDKEFGLEALLALSAGLPVLVHGESGFGEALRDVTFGTSAIVDSDDAREWASRIITIREADRKTRLEQAAMLRSNYDEKYSWKKQLTPLVAMMFSMVFGMVFISSFSLTLLL